LPPSAPRSDERNPINLKEWKDYREALDHWQNHVDAPYQESLLQWRRAYREWQAANRIAYMETDGSKQHDDEHAMLLADEVANAANILKTTFTGIVDFKELGGLDVKGLRSSEMIPVLVKAIQDLHAYVHSDGFVEHVIGQMIKHGLRGRQVLRQAAMTVKAMQAEDAHDAALAAESTEAPPVEPSETPPVTD
jgi:hypothetical protein